MFDKIPNKNKLIFLFSVNILFYTLAYKKFFKNTLDTFSLKNDFQNRMSNKEGDVSIELLKDKSIYFDSFLGSASLKTNEIQHMIFSFFSSFDSINVINVEETHIFHSKGYDIVTNIIVIEGEYVDLFKIVYDFEKNKNFAKLMTYNMSINKKRYKVQVQLVIQSVLKPVLVNNREL